MTAPQTKLTVTQRYRLKDLTIEKRQVVTPGRVMLCRGRAIIGYCNVEDLPHTRAVTERATSICLSPADYDDVKGWIG